MSSAPPHRAACAHCGLPTAAPRDVDPAEPRFCCSGCLIAHELTGGAGAGTGDRLLARVVLSACLAMGVMVFSLSLYREAPTDEGGAPEALKGIFRLAAMGLSAPVFLLLGAPLAEAVVRLRRWVSSESLVFTGAFAAWVLSAWNTFAEQDGHVYFDTASAVLVLFGLGRWLDVRARVSARERLSGVLAEAAPTATRVSGADETDVPLATLAAGDVLRLRPGDVVPADGEALEGRTFLDTSPWTGESEPRSVGPGDRLLAGSTVVDGTLLLRVDAPPGERLQDEVERFLRRAADSRPRLVHLADRVSSWFMPAVLALALAVGLRVGLRESFEAGLLRALGVLLISCPCALGIATPLAFWVALGEAWRRGVLLRGSDVLERLARARRVFLDKTGTLTSSELELVAVEPTGRVASDEALRLAVGLEAGSAHPIARALRARGAGGAPPGLEGFRILPGRGVAGRLDGVPHELLRVRDPRGHTTVELSDDRGPLARFSLRASPRPEAHDVVAALARRGLEPRLLSGDGEGPTAELAERLGVPGEAELLPQDKVRRVEASGPAGVVFVGDGWNDAAALAAADVGIAVQGGARASLETADACLFSEDLSAVPGLLDLGRRAVGVARANLVWALGYNSVGIALAASGYLTPVFAASSMVVSSLVVIGNSSRLSDSKGAGGTADETLERSSKEPYVLRSPASRELRV